MNSFHLSIRFILFFSLLFSFCSICLSNDRVCSPDTLDKWFLESTTCFFNTGLSGTFHECAKICNGQYNASLPCIRNREDNGNLTQAIDGSMYYYSYERLHDRYFYAEEKAAYIGLYDIESRDRRWDRWQAEGCSMLTAGEEPYRNFLDGRYVLDGSYEYLASRTDDIPHARALCAVVDPLGTWLKSYCVHKSPCICEYPGRPSEQYLVSDQFEIMKIPALGIFPEYAAYTIFLSLFYVYMFVRTLRVLERDKNWISQRGAFSIIRVPLLCCCVSMFLNILWYPLLLFSNGVQQGYWLRSNWFDLISMILSVTSGTAVSLACFCVHSVILSSTQAFALAKGGVKAARSWSVKLFYAVYIVFLLGPVTLGALRSLIFFDSELTSSVTFFDNLIFWPVVGGMSSLPSFYCGILALRFRTLSQNITDAIRSDNQERSVRCRCVELFRFMGIFSVFIMILSVFFAFYGYIFENCTNRVRLNLEVIPFSCSMVLSLTFIRDAECMVNRNLEKISKSAAEGNNDNVSSHDRDIPTPRRPEWLSNDALRQNEWPSHCWSVSIKDCLKFLTFCRKTGTWTALSSSNYGGNENLINMYDVNQHFITPWTKGTGSSVAGLFREREPSLSQGNPGTTSHPPVDLFISHAWSGSVMETMRAIKSLVDVYYVPERTRIFYCPLCIYQANDEFGLSILEQLNLAPFAQIIKQKPKHGMYVIHTTISEIYTRLWCVHEVDECLIADVDIHGVFDTEKWTEKAFRKQIKAANTREAGCREEDREMLQNKIMERGGFERLDMEVTRFRKSAKKDLRLMLKFEQIFGTSILLIE